MKLNDFHRDAILAAVIVWALLATGILVKVSSDNKAHLATIHKYYTERTLIDQTVKQFAYLCVMEYGTVAPAECIRKCWGQEQEP